MKILAQVTKIKNPNESETKEAKRKDLNSDFVLASFPDYNQETKKLLGIKEVLCQITVLKIPIMFFDGGFGGEKNPCRPVIEGKKGKIPLAASFLFFRRDL